MRSRAFAKIRRSLEKAVGCAPFGAGACRCGLFGLQLVIAISGTVLTKFKPTANGTWDLNVSVRTV